MPTLGLDTCFYLSIAKLHASAARNRRAEAKFTATRGTLKSLTERDGEYGKSVADLNTIKEIRNIPPTDEMRKALNGLQRENPDLQAQQKLDQQQHQTDLAVRDEKTRNLESDKKRLQIEIDTLVPY